MGKLGGLLDESVEEQPSSTRAAPVESKTELIEIVRQMQGRDTALVGPEKPALEQGRHTMDSWKEHMSRIGRCGLVEYDMVVAEAGESGVPTPAIGEDARSRLHRGSGEAFECIAADVGHRSHAYATQAVVLENLDRDRDDCFALGVASTSSFFQASDIGFVNFNDALQTVAFGAHHSATKLMEPRPSRLVALQTENSLDPEGVRPVLVARDLPRREEPGPQRRTRPMEDRAGEDGRLLFATRAHQQGSRRSPRRPAPAASRANKALRPANPLQVGETTPLIGEGRVELRPIAWIIRPCLEFRSWNRQDHNM